MALSFFPFPLRRLAKRVEVALSTFRFYLEIKWAYRTGGEFKLLDSIPTPNKKVLIGIAAIPLAFLTFFILQTDKKETIAISATDTRSDTVVSAPLQSMKVLVAGKKERQLVVAEWFSNSKLTPIVEYPIAIGEKEGRKERQGDLKTPEGLYWIVDRMEDEELPSLYGIRAFVLNYPNNRDKSEKRSGNGIWIHGDETDTQPDKTRGCLALSNKNLEKLTPNLYIGMPVLILPTLKNTEDNIITALEWEALNLEKKRILSTVQARDAFVKAFLERWRAAWEAKDIETYAVLYSSRFTQNGMDYQAWKEYKTGLFTKPEVLNIELTDITLNKLGSNFALVTFLQNYSAGTYRSVEKKQLKLIKSSNEWKITEEAIVTVPQS